MPFAGGCQTDFEVVIFYKKFLKKKTKFPPGGRQKLSKKRFTTIIWELISLF